tara:strand:- start:7352 stop:7897 length:546 start_codon:yes stop_codon:yes gene_type:complete
MVETLSFLAKLNFRCPYCDIKYFKTTHLYKKCLGNKKIKVCKLCNEQIDPDNSSDLVDYYSFNEAIEIVFPRHLHEYNFGALERDKFIEQVKLINPYYKNGNHYLYPDHILRNHYITYVPHRLSKRNKYGEWKVKHYKIRRNIIAKMISNKIPVVIANLILEYLQNEELSIIFNNLLHHTR